MQITRFLSLIKYKFSKESSLRRLKLIASRNFRKEETRLTWACLAKRIKSRSTKSMKQLRWILRYTVMLHWYSNILGPLITLVKSTLWNQWSQSSTKCRYSKLITTSLMELAAKVVASSSLPKTESLSLSLYLWRKNKTWWQCYQSWSSTWKRPRVSPLFQEFTGCIKFNTGVCNQYFSCFKRTT